MYLNKFSSGTILALLALSGMFVLVPIVAPVHATQNGSLPTLTVGTNVYASTIGTAGTTVKIANPITNSYAITTITIFAPANFAFTAATEADDGVYFTGVTQSASADIFTGSLPPGFTATETLGTITSSVASPVSAAPPQSTFSTTVIDGGSAPGSYPGPTWIVYTVNGATANPVVTIPAGDSTFVAGSAPITVTATLATNQPGVPITFKVNTAATSPFTATVSPSSTTTVAGASSSTATTSFAPSNHATDSTTIQATIGSSAFTGASPAVTTVAGSPSSVAWTIGTGPGTAFGAGTNLYLSNGVAGVSFAATHYSGTTIEAIYAGGAASSFYVAVSDAFGNPLNFAALSASTMVTITAPSGIGAWDQGTVNALNPITCSDPAAPVNNGVSCTTGQMLDNYAQTLTYGTTTVLQATITGSYPAVGGTAFSVAATSGDIITGTEATGLTIAVTGAPTYGVGTTVTLTATQTASSQTGVPVTFNACGWQKGATVCLTATPSFGGSFSNGAQVGLIVPTSGASGTSTATYTLPTVLNQKVSFNATEPQPNGATPTPVLTSNILAGLGPTVPGSAVGFQVVLYLGCSGSTRSEEFTGIGPEHLRCSEPS